MQKKSQGNGVGRCSCTSGITWEDRGRQDGTGAVGKARQRQGAVGATFRVGGHHARRLLLNALEQL